MANIETVAHVIAELRPSRQHHGVEIVKGLQAMRAACRKFLDAVEHDGDRRIIHHAFQHGHAASWLFNSALGELRGVFGVHLLQIAAEYGLGVEDDLAVILPAKAEEGSRPTRSPSAINRSPQSS